MPDRIDIYRDTAGWWRWRRIAPNGEPLSGPQESFTRRADAERAAERANPDLQGEEET